MHSTTPCLRSLTLQSIATFIVEKIQQRRSAQSGVPFVLGIAGSVAVGKSKIAGTLADALQQQGIVPRVLCTDHFLYPNAELAARGLAQQKGFPDSYDGPLLYQTLHQLKHERTAVTIPVYSHQHYDREPHTQRVAVPEVLILEGLNVLQHRTLRDFLDFSIYVDADEEQIRAWYLSRFQEHCVRYVNKQPSPASGRGEDKNSGSVNHYWSQYANLSVEQRQEKALFLWEMINAPNLRTHIRPTKKYAELVLYKGVNHAIQALVLQSP